MHLKNENEVLNILQKAAKAMELDYDAKNYTCLKVSAEEFYLAILLVAPFEPYSKYGNNIGERLLNKDNFFASDVFNKLLRLGVAGTAFYQNHPRTELVKKYVPELYQKIALILETNKSLAMMYVPESMQTNEKFFRVLCHEYLHILLQLNHYDFKSEKEQIIHLIESLIGTKPLKTQERLLSKYKKLPLVQKLHSSIVNKEFNK